MSSAYVFDGARLVPLNWTPQRTLRWGAWRPDGAVMLLAGNGGSAALWDGRRLQHLEPGTKHNLRGAAWAPDGSLALLAGNRGAVIALQGESMQELVSPTAENLRRVAWHPGGDYALIAGNAGVILRYDRASGALYALPGDRAHTLRSVAFRPDGAYALVGAYASRFAGYPRPHPLYRCDGRYLQALLASDDEDDFVSADWSQDGRALVCGYAWQAGGPLVNKALIFDGSAWSTRQWGGDGVVLGGAWRPGSGEALLAGEGGLLLRLDQAGLQSLETGTRANLVGPFWRPDGSEAVLLRGPNEKVYTV